MPNDTKTHKAIGKKFASVEAARLALLGGILVAIVGLIGAALNAYATYMGNRTQAEIPIQATQTKEAFLTEIVSKALKPITPGPKIIAAGKTPYVATNVPARQFIVPSGYLTNQSSQGSIAFQDYAWIDSVPVSVGFPDGIEVAGENLGTAPWIIIEVSLYNSSEYGQRLRNIGLEVNSFEPLTPSTQVLTVDGPIVPSFLVPTDCPESAPSAYGPRAFAPPSENHLLGILSTTNEFTEFRANQWIDPSLQPTKTVNYLLFISANENGIYNFSVKIDVFDGTYGEWLYIGPITYAFLDPETAIDMPKEYIDKRCP